MPFCFCGKPTLVPIFNNLKKERKKEKKNKKEFLLLLKGVKMKIVLIICFAVNLSRMAAPPWESTLSISLAAQH